MYRCIYIHVHCCMSQALCLTIECVEWGDTELSGRSLNSLLDLLLNQASQVSNAHHNKRYYVTTTIATMWLLGVPLQQVCVYTLCMYNMYNMYNMYVCSYNANNWIAYTVMCLGTPRNVVIEHTTALGEATIQQTCTVIHTCMYIASMYSALLHNTYTCLCLGTLNKN